MSILKSVGKALFGSPAGNAVASAEGDEARKAAARAKINELFGISTAPQSTAPSGAGFGRFGFGQIAPPAPVDPYTPDTIGPRNPTEAERNKSGLDALYGKVRTDAFTGMRRQLDEQKADTGRQLKFELFARGLRGGSADIEQNARLNRGYTDSLGQIGARADGLAADMRTNDEQTRLGLLQSIDSGMDQGSALSSALNQLRNNADRSYSQAQGSTIGDMLSAGGFAYGQNQRAKGQQRAQQEWWRARMPSNAGGSAAPIITRD